MPLSSIPSLEQRTSPFQEDQIIVHDARGLFVDSGKQFSQNVDDLSDKFVWDGPTAKSVISNKISILQQSLKATTDGWCPADVGTSLPDPSSNPQFFKKMDPNSTVANNLVVFQDGELADSGVQVNDNVDPFDKKSLLSASKIQNMMDSIERNLSAFLHSEMENVVNTKFPIFLDGPIALRKTFLNFEGTWIPPVTGGLEKDLAVMTESTPKAQLFGYGTPNFGSWVKPLTSNSGFPGFATETLVSKTPSFVGQSPVNVIVIPDNGFYFLTVSGKWIMNYPINRLTWQQPGSLNENWGQLTIGLKNLRSGKVSYTPDFLTVCHPHFKSQRRTAAVWHCLKGDKIAIIALQTIPDKQVNSTETAQMWFKGSIFPVSRCPV